MNIRIVVPVLVAVALLCVLRVGAAERGSAVVRVGFVTSYSPSTIHEGATALWQRLEELGWVQGKNLAVEARWGEGKVERVPALVGELTTHKLDLLITSGTPAAIAAKKATTTIPIVAVAMGDPLRVGLVASLARPGGNLTGFSLAWGAGVVGKWLELLQETVPKLSAVAVILNPDNVVEREMLKDLRRAAAKRSLTLRTFEVREARELDPALEQARRRTQAMLVFGDAILLAYKERVVAFAARHRIPAIYAVRDFVDVGGLMAYAPDLTSQYRRAADYVDKILRGAKPGDLPVEQPTEFNLVVNLKTANALGLTVPESVLARAQAVLR